MSMTAASLSLGEACTLGCTANLHSFLHNSDGSLRSAFVHLSASVFTLDAKTIKMRLNSNTRLCGRFGLPGLSTRNTNKYCPSE